LNDIENLADFYASRICLEQLNSRLDYVCLGCPKGARN